MPETRLIYPTRPGVLHPDGRALSTAGETVAWSSWWVRRQRAGEITLTAPSAADPDPLPPQKTKRETSL